MNRAVLVSIKPQWCELIASGKKTVELRKTKPKLRTPFKVYIYCTQGEALALPCLNNPRYTIHRMNNGTPNGRKMTAEEREQSDHQFANGKVIGEFVCDRIETVLQCNSGWVQENACISKDAFFDYLGIPRDTHLGYDKKAYGWHISELVIYDKPKELSEFYCKCEDYPACDDCEFCSWTNEEGYECVCDYEKPLKRPPQSWCYVEELK